MLYKSKISRTIVYDHRLKAGTTDVIFAAVSQCYPSESGAQYLSPTAIIVSDRTLKNPQGLWEIE